MTKSAKVIAYLGICVALMVVCAYICVPILVPITLQTFALFFIYFTFGGKIVFLTSIIYALLGVIGLPVFAGFNGIGTFLSPTGGFIIGFVFTSAFLWGTEKFSQKNYLKISFSLIGLVICYIFGTIFFAIFVPNVNFLKILYACILPFIIPDLIKIFLSFVVANKILERKNENFS